MPPSSHFSSAIPSQLGANLRKIRESKKLTQKELALRLGYKGKDAGAVINRIENNAQEPRWGKLERIAKVLGVKVEKLLRN